jgi:cytochrome P450
MRASPPPSGRLPPGPRFGALSTLRYARSPASYVAKMRARFGDAWTVEGLNGKLLFTVSPAHVRDVLTADPSMLALFGGASIGDLLGRRALLGTAGEPHRRDRKLLAPPFRGQRMRAYGEIMREVARERTAHLRPGDRFRAHDVTSRIAMDVILRAVFGLRRGVESQRAEAVLDGLLAAVDPLLFFVKRLRTRLYPPFRRYQEALERYDRLVRPLISERRESAPGEDVLGLMIAARYDDGSAMSDDVIRDQLLTLLLAGHETTAIALAWSLRALATHPAVRDRARSEIAALGSDPAPEALAAIPYLGAICDETMRRHTIVTDVSRGPTSPLRVGEWEVPAGCGVIVGIVGIHADPTLYPEPAAFRPERFLDKHPSPFEFLPFGGGHRRCLGAAFSDFEMRVVLGTLIADLDLALDDDRPEPAVRRNVTMGPARGVPMRVVSRRR